MRKTKLLLLIAALGSIVVTIPVMADVKVNYADFNPYNSYSNYYASPIAEIENTGEDIIRVGDASFDVEDSGDRLLRTIEYVSVAPAVLAPGEKGYLYRPLTQIDDIADPFDCHISVNFKQKKVNAESYRYELSDVAMNIMNGEDYEVVGKITNTSDKQSEDLRLAVIWFDTNKRCIGVSESNIYDDILPGESKSFTIEGKEAWMEDQTKIATYRIIAEEIPRTSGEATVVHIPYSEMVNAE